MKKITMLLFWNGLNRIRKSLNHYYTKRGASTKQEVADRIAYVEAQED
ncbi:MAG: hypothetical protein ACJAVN_001886 [Roseivirga sp.]|jgi:hypothetical protein